MDRNRVTVRYARALVEFASEQNVLDEVDHDLRVLYQAFIQYKGFASYVLNPGVASHEKLKKMKAVFSPEFHPLSIRFLEMVFANKREQYLKDLCRNCIVMARKRNHIIAASLVAAKPLSGEVVNRIKEKFEKRLNATLELKTDTDQGLIGGFVFTIDGEQYDASIAAKINLIKKQLYLK